MYKITRIVMGLGFVFASATSAFADKQEAITVCASKVQAMGQGGAYKLQLASSLATARTGHYINAFLIGLLPKEKPELASEVFVLVQHDASHQISCLRLLQVNGISVTISQGNPLVFSPSLSSSIEGLFDAIPNGSNFIAKHTTFFIGKAKENNEQTEFLKLLASHVEHARATFQPKGLVGYVGLAALGYEMTFMSWTSQQAMQDAFASDEGKSVVIEAGTFLENVQFTEETDFSGVLEFNQLYRIK